jgi:hypothetical protein
MADIIFGVSSVGLGHVKRSLIVANELRSRLPSASVEWVCAEPALTFLRLKGEAVLDVSSRLESVSRVFEENSYNGGIRNMAKLARLSYSVARRNYVLVKPCLSKYDVLVQDEFMETLLAPSWDSNPPLPRRRAVITDYVEIEASTMNPYNWVTVLYANRLLKKAFMNQTIRIFADDLDALPGKAGLRKWVETNFLVTGPIVEGAPTQSRAELKLELFGPSSQSKLIVFSIGGTTIGERLLRLAADNADKLSSELDAAIVILTGPRLDASSFAGASNTLRVVPFTTDSIRYFAAADCLVTQAGASTLNEASALGVPCVCIPISNHWEQLRNAQRFSKRLGFVVLGYDELTLDTLVDAIKRSMLYPRHSQEKSPGAESRRVAAEVLCELIASKT